MKDKLEKELIALDKKRLNIRKRYKNIKIIFSFLKS